MDFFFPIVTFIFCQAIFTLRKAEFFLAKNKSYDRKEKIHRYLDTQRFRVPLEFRESFAKLIETKVKSAILKNFHGFLQTTQPPEKAQEKGRLKLQYFSSRFHVLSNPNYSGIGTRNLWVCWSTKQKQRISQCQ
jgi:hypothetical protein